MDIQSLSVSYGKQKVLKDLNLTLKPNGVNGLVGINGAGKTTLLNTLAGLKKRDTGHVIWEGAPLESSQIGFLETENYFYPKMKGREYLEVFALSNAKFNPDAWNALFGLPLDKLIEDYSTGMKKKLAIMGICGLDRPILFLDEPFNGVDLESNEKIKLVMRKLTEQGKTILVTSHILETLTTICDQISVLMEGTIERTAERPEYENLVIHLTQKISDSAQTKIDQIFNDSPQQPSL